MDPSASMQVTVYLPGSLGVTAEPPMTTDTPGSTLNCVSAETSAPPGSITMQETLKVSPALMKSLSTTVSTVTFSRSPVIPEEPQRAQVNKMAAMKNQAPMWVRCISIPPSVQFSRYTSKANDDVFYVRERLF